tara:strand:- start:544 stop:726 length:183 start_codon:yes stop_codon:yes gene_type:complete
MMMTFSRLHVEATLRSTVKRDYQKLNQKDRKIEKLKNKVRDMKDLINSLMRDLLALQMKK